MIEIAVCDDDRDDLAHAVQLVNEVCKNEVIAYGLRQYVRGKQMLETNFPIDIGILDISMEDLNGIDLGIALKKRFPDIRLVYMTSFEEYCKQAINRVHAFSFLTKPVCYEDMRDQMTALLDGIKEDGSGRKREFRSVFTKEHILLDSLWLYLKEILYFEYIKTERNIRIVCKEECYKFPYVMEILAEELKSSGFAVNCRGMLVNMLHIRKIKGYTIYLDNGKELPLSQKRKAEFAKQLNAFMHNHFD